MVQLGKLGSWLLCVYGGVYGRRRMLETLKMLRTKLRKFAFYTLYSWMATHHRLLVANFAIFF